MSLPELYRSGPTRTALVCILIAFVVAANIAWLNPRPGFSLYRTMDSVPFMWQYNADAGMEIISAAYFPEAFRTYPQRINRPLYPALAWSFGAIVGTALSPWVALSPLQRAGVGYIILKLLVHGVAAIALVDLLRRRMSTEAVSLAVALVFLHPHTIAHIATFHTTELQLLVPVLVIWMAVRGRNNVFLWSLVIGMLMMGKQNFAVYAALLAWGVWQRRYRDVAISLLGFLVPLVLYVLFLRVWGLSYRNNEIQGMDQGVWVVSLLLRSPIQFIQTILQSMQLFLENSAVFSGPLLLLAVAALAHPRQPLATREAVFLGLLVMATWAQYLAVNRFSVAYLTGDFFVFVAGLSAWLLVDVWGIGSRRRFVLPAVVIVYGALSILSFVNVPWVSPWEQTYRDPAYLESRRETVQMEDRRHRP